MTRNPENSSLSRGGGSIDPKSGVYTPSSDFTDAIIGRRDGQGTWSYAFVKVTSADMPVALSPSAVLLAPGTQITLEAAGGTSPYIYSVNLGSASSVDAISGVFTAAPQRRDRDGNCDGLIGKDREDFGGN